MANPIHCDGDCGQLADVMVSRLQDGETTAWCFAEYVGVCQAVVSAAEEAAMAPEPTEPAAEPEPQPEPTEAQVEDEDQRIAERLTRYAASQAANEEAPISSGDEPADLGDAGGPEQDPVAADTPGPSVGDTSSAPASEPGPIDQSGPAASSQAAGPGADTPTGPTVVRKGTSAGRRRHEAKQRAKAQAAEAADQKEASE